MGSLEESPNVEEEESGKPFNQQENENKKPNDNILDEIEEQGFDNCVYITSSTQLAAALQRGNGVMRTRFPPEPSGFLHLGHVRALEINVQTAEHYSGRCSLRFDDSNPSTVSRVFYQQIVADIKWLGYKMDGISQTSEYFPLIYEMALKLITKHRAYVCHEESVKNIEQKHNRKDSIYRNRASEDNMTEFVKMFLGRYGEGKAVLRLKYKTLSGFNDPVMFRVNNTKHCVTGNLWNIYPTYDFCHPICDSIEGIGISLCSEEFESHRDLYEFILNSLEMNVPQQREFQRLNFPFNLTSKRLVRKLEEAGIITGGDDPRLLTVAGLRRRGFSAEVVRAFASLPSDERTLSSLHEQARNVLGEACQRRMVVIDSLECFVQNFDLYRESLPKDIENITVEEESPTVTFDVPNHPTNEMGKRDLVIGERIWINNFDFLNTSSKSKHYLTLSQGVYLKYTSSMMKVCRLEGNRLNVKLEYHPKKVPKTKVITWLSQTSTSTLNIFEDILVNKDISPDMDIAEQINKDSHLKTTVLVEKCVSDGTKIKENFNYNQTFQAERVGYVTVDEDSTPSNLQLNVTTFLKLHPDMLANIKRACK